MQKMFRLFLFSVLLILGMGQSSHALIINGDFSSGLNNWHTEDSNSTPSPAVSVVSGMALLETQPNLTDGTSSKSFISLSQHTDISSNADTLTFDVFFDRVTEDLNESTNGFHDFFQVSYLDDTNSLFDTYFLAMDSSSTYDPITLNPITLTGPVNGLFTFTTDITGLSGHSGTLYFDLSDGYDGYDSIAKVDNVSITTTPVPEPSTLLLLGTGLLGLFIRRFKRV